MAKPTRRPLMAGNWKMNVNHLDAIALVQKLAFSLSEQELEAVEVVVLPAFTSLRSVQTLIDGDKLKLGYGAQDLSPHKPGAYTGDIAGSMLAKLGCQYVVVGHSERRAYHAEDDTVVAAKVKAALDNELTPILCVGEGLEVREAGEHVAHTVAQLDGALAGRSADEVGKVVVAYEPVWAIGTGKTATPADAQEVIGALRARLRESFGDSVADAARILYGGSVKPNNTAEIMAEPDIDGALVGGASLVADDFVAICRYQQHQK
ncbi:triose-phosphate isomerase [Natronosporangium hydrolyticum]|uniref:Triosephosphate isomerase n=1 Tax=Natronosporangium hydrolyticum TaxID=2811111 RepID=A0A895YFI2_9ACTN|nr:triose-phosphate isomerase [Natronosporangium hydrolyticum]QSB12940.1 triose-phosphate isomerase [Natronosporangium hydrolyticum]